MGVFDWCATVPPPKRVRRNFKLQHWRGLPSIFASEAAPMLEFDKVFLVARFARAGNAPFPPGKVGCVHQTGNNAENDGICCGSGWIIEPSRPQLHGHGEIQSRDGSTAVQARAQELKLRRSAIAGFVTELMKRRNASAQ